MTQEQLKDVWNSIIKIINNTTGIKWVKTSWIRNSLSHTAGLALDIAPRLRELAFKYATSFNRDPLLNMRVEPARALSKLPFRSINTLIRAKLGVNRELVLFIETDHIHMYLALPKTRRRSPPIFRWWNPKSTRVYQYADVDYKRAKSLYDKLGPLSANEIRTIRS